MATYIISVRVVLEVEAVDRETAIDLAEDAARHTRFAVSHRFLDMKKMGTEEEDGQKGGRDGRA